MSCRGIEHQAIRVSLVTGLGTILSIGFQLLSVPICLKFWGQETYGNWLVLFSVFQLLRSLESGYVSYVGNKLNYLYHQDTHTSRKHLSSATAGIILIGSIQLFLVIGILVSDRISIMLGMHVSKTATMDKLGLLIMMTSWVLTGSYVGILHRLLIPAGLMYQAAWGYILFQVSQFAAIMVAALLRLDMLQTSILFALSQLIIYLMSAIYVRHKLPAYYPWWQGGRVSIGLKDLGQSTLLTISNLIQQGVANGGVLVISMLAGPAAVPVFTTVRTVSNLWTNVTNVLTTPLLSDMVRFHAKDEAYKLMTLNQVYWVLVVSIVNWGVLLSYPLLASLYGYWTGHTVVLNKALLCLLLGSVVVSSAGGLMFMHLSGINSLRIVLGTSVVRGVLGLGIGVLGYQQLGLVSFGLGVLVGELVVLVMTVYCFVKYELFDKGIKMPLSDYLPAMLSTGSVLLFLVGQCFWLPILSTWLMAMASTVIAFVWGWSRLDSAVKIRLVSLVGDRFVKKIVK